jgi:beta-glucosidase
MQARTMWLAGAAAMMATGMAASLSAQQGTARTGAAPAPSAVAHPDTWPALTLRRHRDPKVEARVEATLRRMSIEDKVGQLMQIDIGSITPKDVETYKIGSVLNGGSSGPYGNDKAPAADWLRLADEFYAASMKRSDGRPAVPIIWGTDAVHGANNIVGGTLYPHNIGLGAMRDPELVKRIGRATAEETAATGQDWTFAPTVAVVQDDRWGRTYESYSEDPAIVRAYSGKVVEGIQGTVGTDFMGPGYVMSSIKHFLGDGGTGGRDQGDTQVTESVLRDVHAAGYISGLEAGALIVMPSFSSWNGAKMTGNKSLLTGVLKERWGFDGFAVSDWNAHGQVPGCTTEDCPGAINAGLDMFMYSGSKWKDLYANTLAEAKDGRIPAARLDDAVRRILRVKYVAGTFDRGRPSSRPLAGDFTQLGSPAHRALAREAVAKSLVLLKNNGGVLPLKSSANILVAGTAADSIAQAAGGWSITWQGTEVSNADFPHGQTIWRGIEEAARAGGGRATLSPDGAFTAKPDAAIVVFGETPYAEFVGDRPTLEYSAADKSDLALLKKLKSQGVPVVAVFLSGRPLWVNPELNAADAFVAAFLPGTEGGGVADVLIGDKAGKPRRDFTGTLSFSWPKRLDQYVLNRRDPNYDPLFPLGYGLTYAKPGTLARLDETRPANAGGDIAALFTRGRVLQGAQLSSVGAVTSARIDRRAQEDSLRLLWSGNGEGRVAIQSNAPIDYSREANGDLALVVEYRLSARPAAPVTLAMTGGKEAAVPVAALLTAAPGTWAQFAVPLRCFADGGVDMKRVSIPFTMTTAGALGIDVSAVQVASVPVAGASCPR